MIKMLSQASETAVKGIGSIKEVFTLPGRGIVLALNNHFDGTISQNGRVRSEHGISNFTGPAFMDGKHEDGTRFARLAIIATDPSSADWFLMGDKVCFQRDRRRLHEYRQCELALVQISISVSSVSSVDKP